MRCLFLFICVLCAFTSSKAQNTCVIKGRIIDKDLASPVARAHIKVVGTQEGAYSNIKGEFELKVNCNTAVKLEISSINYLTAKKTFSINEVQKSPIEVDIKLEFNIYEIPGAEVFDTPDTVYANTEYHVADFAFAHNGGMLLLAYGKEKRWKRQEQQSTTIYDNCCLIWLDSLENEKDQYLLHSECLGFYVDYMDDIFLKTTEREYRVDILNDKLSLLPVSAEEFHGYVEPVIDSIGEFVYVTNYNPDFPAFEYYGINKSDSSFHHLHYVVDEPLMEMFRSEYKYLDPRGKLEAFRYEVLHGIDKEVVAAYMSGFAQTNYYEPLYAPFFVWKDTVMIFDHYHDKMFKFDRYNEVIDSVAISYHRDVRRSEWQKKMTQDEVTGDIYGVFKRNGSYFLQKIDTETGNTEECFKLTHRYTDSIRIRDGWAYYVYRPFESPQKKFLYKEAIRNNAVFGAHKKS
jgi:hypothetical protein